MAEHKLHACLDSCAESNKVKHKRKLLAEMVFEQVNRIGPTTQHQFTCDARRGAQTSDKKTEGH